ncbi:hypothetical protein ACS0TY_015486 [Phlomoides rotata]
MSKAHTFTLKAVINKQKTRVLFAEIDNSFADVLFSFSTLSPGLIMRALVTHYGDKTPAFGSLNNLYNSFKTFFTTGSQLNLVYRLLEQATVYDFPFSEKYSCSSPELIHYDSSYNESYFRILSIFPLNTSFIICDDLRVVPDGEGSILKTFNSVGVDRVDMDGAETRIVTLGVNEVMDFLVRLLVSHRPLTDFVLGTSLKSGQESSVVQTNFPKIRSEVGEFSGADEVTENKIILKLFLHKSTNKLLFAQADYRFVNYLYSMLRIPLETVDFLLGGNTCLNNICTLNRSLTGFSRKYFDDKDAKPEAFPLKEYFKDESRMFMVTDDLTVTRSSLVSGISIFAELKISIFDVEELDLQIGIEEASSLFYFIF